MVTVDPSHVLLSATTISPFARTLSPPSTSSLSRLLWRLASCSCLCQIYSPCRPEKIICLPSGWGKRLKWVMTSLDMGIYVNFCRVILRLVSRKINLQPPCGLPVKPMAISPMLRSSTVFEGKFSSSTCASSPKVMRH